MLQAKSKVIDGLEYKVTQLGAKEGRRLLTRLVKVAGPMMAGAGTGDVSGALERALGGLKDEDVDFLCDTLARSTEVQVDSTHQPLLADIFDSHFAGNYHNLMKWLAFALEVNFGSFFQMAVALKSAVSASPATAAE